MSADRIQRGANQARAGNIKLYRPGYSAYTSGEDVFFQYVPQWAPRPGDMPVNMAAPSWGADPTSFATYSRQLLVRAPLAQNFPSQKDWGRHRF